ncbi:PSD1 and planctomycete cytochrome C domain-containing protein [Planctomicrobium sp. SH664]|uniref:PSD1 and planctomycete cytochrome C domain-containing protein n=1 Tax=Planctomicrobium sp. SH664 TaxID=3448125 RepID=UPI003F5BD314
MKHLWICGILVWAAASAVAAEPIDFGRQIRPLLSDRCFKCHGPDAQNRSADLRLDVRDEAVAAAIVPGAPADSEIIARITTDDPELKMPPVKSDRRPLSPDEVALLKQWVQEGAPYAEHWAYTPPVQGTPPEVKLQDWPINEIDRFTLAGMESAGLAPSAMADPRTLVRRLYLDLTGLPPTPEDVAAFCREPLPATYEALVDRLLASEHFGEQMAMYWLDLVRYADTGGYHSDNEREVDAFRDYVIDSFNRNKPFDQFTIEQLAGDLLPDATLEQRIGSGYNRMLQTTQEGGAQPKEYTAIYLADRVRNVSTVWMASTMGCCQCHDHKFDPFSLKDFYALGAFFADLSEVAVGPQPPNLQLPTPEQAKQMETLQQQIDELETAPPDPAVVVEWVRQQSEERARSGGGLQVSIPLEAVSTRGTELVVDAQGIVLARGTDPDHEEFRITLAATAPVITGIRLEALVSSSFPKKGLGRSNGNFELSEFIVEVLRDGKTEPVKITDAVADYEQKKFPILNAVDGRPETAWAVDGNKRAQNCTALFAFENPVSGGEGVQLVVTLRHDRSENRNVGKFRLSLSSDPELLKRGLTEHSPELVALFNKPEDKWKAAERQQVEAAYLAMAPQHKERRKQIEDLKAELANVRKTVRTLLVSESLPMPRDVRVLPRGNWMDDSGELLQPAIPSTFGELQHSDQRATRLDLARWLVDRKNPLTARVFVNRVWKLMFGAGLVRSLEDFGYQGDWPTHPELLDWLSVDFMDHGWDVKRLVRQLVMSRTYQQSSLASRDALQRDPFNKFLARQSRFRMNAETVRDNALAVSGLLVKQVGGPSVKPYQPKGYWVHLNFPMREWETDHGANQYRRGLYTFWCRTFLHPSLLAFDAPSREECTAERPRSNTPLQALVLLNDPTYVEAARVLAQQIAALSGSDEDRLDRAFQIVLQRSPQPEETAVLLPLLHRERTVYQEDTYRAEALLKAGDAPADGSLPASEIAAWTAVTRVLLNLHETVTRD